MHAADAAAPEPSSHEAAAVRSIGNDKTQAVREASRSNLKLTFPIGFLSFSRTTLAPRLQPALLCNDQVTVERRLLRAYYY